MSGESGLQVSNSGPKALSADIADQAASIELATPVT
jgi:hypothetical protein